MTDTSLLLEHQVNPDSLALNSSATSDIKPINPAIDGSSFDFNSQTQAEKVLLIDLENCPNQIQHIHENLSAFSRVVICYAHCTAKIPLDWLIPLNNTINQNRLKIIRMTEKGKNSADFGIAFFAGMLMQEMPEQAEFTILSDDTDLDHVVNLLISQHRAAERIGVNIQYNKSTAFLFKNIVPYSLAEKNVQQNIQACLMIFVVTAN